MEGLSIQIDLNVRFSETDAMGVVWHGNYLKFFEDAREAFCEKFGVHSLEIYKQGFFIPIVRSEVDHKAPIYYGQKVRVIATYKPVVAAKIIHEYQIINLETNQLSATGKTVQVFLTEKERTLSLHKPDFYMEWEKKVGIKFD